ncbi:MAG TPA: hypothetical protein VMH00_12545 [Candidatus Limnocylindrales bacterium]|nr:hypothetical protein [Candidatus Limnocylindrales bacterium]
MLQRALIILFLSLAAPVASWACICSQAPPGQCPGLQKDDVVFVGTVTQTVYFPHGLPAAGSDSSAPSAAASNAPGVIRYHFRIDEKFSGAASAEIDIFSGGDDGDCGYRFKDGEQYLVYTQQETEGRLFATRCNGTRPASDALAVLPQLRAMRDGRRVASVFGILRHAQPPTLALPDDPDDPLPNVALKLRSRYDRFTATTDEHGVYSFYDVHAGEYQFTADLPPTVQLSQRTLTGPLPTFTIPANACYEYDVDALPTGSIQGSVLGPDGKPLRLASVELFRVGTYNGSRSGLWTFQGSKGFFEFDHIGAGEYVIVYNRGNRMDPSSPFPRTFYPGVEDLTEAKPVEMKEGEELTKIDFSVKGEYATRELRVHLNWKDGKPPGIVTVMARADKGDNPAAQKIDDGAYSFTLIKAAHYTVSAWEQLDPTRGGPANCTLPPRIDSDSIVVDGADDAAKDITLTFASPTCGHQ